MIWFDSAVGVVSIRSDCELVGSGGDGVLINGIDGLFLNVRRAAAV